MIGKFFHTPRAKRFNITTRYYDPAKEEMKEREERIKKELGIEEEKKEINENYRPAIKGQFRRGMGEMSKTVAEERRKMNTRLIILVLILSLAFYLMFKF
ncbi:MAG: hypothetical protein ACK5JD_06030 [Mangrovibacterium sp.]